MTISWKAQQGEGKYSLQFETNHKEEYKLVEKAAQMAVDGKTIADITEVRHGEWFVLDECANEGVYCSVCHKKVYRVEYANQKVKSNFCPNCGACMDGKGESNGDV